MENTNLEGLAGTNQSNQGNISTLSESAYNEISIADISKLSAPFMNTGLPDLKLTSSTTAPELPKLPGMPELPKLPGMPDLKLPGMPGLPGINIKLPEIDLSNINIKLPEIDHSDLRLPELPFLNAKASRHEDEENDPRGGVKDPRRPGDGDEDIRQGLDEAEPGDYIDDFIEEQEYERAKRDAWVR